MESCIKLDKKIIYGRIIQNTDLGHRSMHRTENTALISYNMLHCTVASYIELPKQHVYSHCRI